MTAAGRAGCYRHGWLAALSMALWPMAAPGADPGSVSGGLGYALDVAAENYRWQEFDQAGQRLLTEQGPRYRLGLGVRYRGRGGFIGDAVATGYSGAVNYDGQDNNGVFTGSTTSYEGWTGEVSIGYRAALSDTSDIDVRAGAGTERWTREIRAGINASGQPVAGFVELYAISYAKLGLGVEADYRGFVGYLELGLKQPVAADEDVAINGQDVRLYPGRGRSLYASYQISWEPRELDDHTGRFVRIYYEGFRFDKSPARSVGLVTVWQPESRADLLGVALGIAF